MSLATYASPIDYGTPLKKMNKNKTIKNTKVIDMINKIHNKENDEGSESEHEIEFDPPEKPISTGVEKTEDVEEIPFQPEPVIETSNSLQTNNIEWKEQPLHNQLIQNNTNNELNEKLNYLIYLLEDDREIKTHNVTEEVILYAFLGIFIIFVIDTFSKSGKYSR